MSINKIVIHCSATKNGVRLRSREMSAAQRIDGWHAQRGFKRHPSRISAFNPHLKHIGYHFVIDTDGKVETGRQIGETGAHVRGHNTQSIGICMVGGLNDDGRTSSEKNHSRFTAAQWEALHQLLRQLESRYPEAKICGHRDLSPDLNKDGVVSKQEWLKTCPNFDVWEWLDSEQVINAEHLY